MPLTRFLKGLFHKPHPSHNARGEMRLERAAEQFRNAAEATAGAQSKLFWQLAGAATTLREQLKKNPRATLDLKRMVLVHIPEMAQTALDWAQLSQKDPLRKMDPRLFDDFKDYLSVIEQTAETCAAGKYDALQSANAALEEIMGRRNP